MIPHWAVLLLLVAATAGAVYGILPVIVPWLRSLALARPNARSSHTVPTPQGAGLVIVPVAICGAAIAALSGAPLPAGGVAFAAGTAIAALTLMLVGLMDDIRDLSIVPRLATQIVVVALVLLLLPESFRILPHAVPLFGERALALVAILWFVNLANFMDGMDLLSATEAMFIAAGALALSLLGYVPASLGWWAAVLLGAMGGFLRWNAPPARVFLGDAGSLPIGFLLAVLLLQVAGSGAWAAAVILPLYYLMDASITLVRRVCKRERFWEAHRQHFYQRALTQGHPVGRIISVVALLNVLLIVIAIVVTAIGTMTAALLGLTAAVLLVGGVLAMAETKPRRP